MLRRLALQVGGLIWFSFLIWLGCSLIQLLLSRHVRSFILFLLWDRESVIYTATLLKRYLWIRNFVIHVCAGQALESEIETVQLLIHSGHFTLRGEETIWAKKSIVLRCIVLFFVKNGLTWGSRCRVLREIWWIFASVGWTSIGNVRFLIRRTQVL